MKTLLDGVNEVLKRVKIVQGDNGELTTLTDSARQTYIDSCIQIWNEIIDELYMMASKPKPNQTDEKQITLAANKREYLLNDSLTRLHWPLRDETNGQFIYEYPGGYMEMRSDQAFPDNYTGVPSYGAFNPDNGKLYLDRIPTSSEAGRIYKYTFEKDMELTAATDTFPFKNVVFRALVPAAAEKWKYDQHGKGDPFSYRRAVGVASNYLSQNPKRDTWTPTRRVANSTDPYVK